MSSKRLTAWQRLSRRVLSVEQVRRIDHQATADYGMHSLVLMENAALNCVRWLESRFADRPQAPHSVVLCGSGNNGGDGAAIARHLGVLGWPCVVYMLGPLDKLSPDAAANANILSKAGDRLLWWQASYQSSLRDDLARAELIVDAMLGTGATGNPRPPFDDWIVEANASQAYRVAIDMPTGVDASSGRRGRPSFAADATLSFVARKPGMSHDDASDVFGEIHVLPIGIPASQLQAVLDELDALAAED